MPRILAEDCSAENNSITVAWQPHPASFVEGFVLELDDGVGVATGRFRVSHTKEKKLLPRVRNIINKFSRDIFLFLFFRKFTAEKRPSAQWTACISILFITPALKPSTVAGKGPTAIRSVFTPPKVKNLNLSVIFSCKKFYHFYLQWLGSHSTWRPIRLKLDFPLTD